MNGTNRSAFLFASEPEEPEDDPDSIPDEPDDEPPRGEHMPGCIWISGSWDCDGACIFAAYALANYMEAEHDR